MRFACKVVPHGDGFDPCTEAGWQRLDEPAPSTFTVCALALSALLGAVFFAVWVAFFRSTGAVIDDDAIRTNFWWVLLSYPVLIVVHELVHMFVHPGQGRSRDSVLGAIPAQAMAYAAYMGEMSRERMMGTLIAPLLVLTVLPWGICVAEGHFSYYWAGTSILNGASAAGDVLGIALLLRGTPRRARMRNQGWQTYWRVADASGAAADSTMGE